MNEAKPIREKERASIIQALRAGVVPRAGLRHIQVGRVGEVEALIKDIDLIADGGSSFRFVIGEYGAGKTFFLNLIRLMALEKKLLVVNADLAPNRRLHATGGQARSLFAELAGNFSTRSKPDGGALPSIVERFVAEAVKESRETDSELDSVIERRLASLEEQVSGYDFSAVLAHYYRSSEIGDDSGKSQALRWLRAEYSTRTEARKEVGVRNIIDDSSFYDYLKLYGQFAVKAGYRGLLVVLDEMVNLYKLNSSQARNANYEQILRMLNDALQGNSSHIGFVMGGTPEFLMDTRRGLYSYEALQSRLAENTFARDGLIDLSGPVIRLQNLSAEDLYVLLCNIRNVFAGGDPSKHMVPDEALQAFMEHCSQRIGDAYFRTPRNSVKAFVDLLSILEQNPGTDWQSLVGSLSVDTDIDPSTLVSDEDQDGSGEAIVADDGLASFKL